MEAYNRGTNVRQLCQTWQIGTDTLYEHLRRAGITPGRYGFGPDKLANARELYESGLYSRLSANGLVSMLALFGDDSPKPA